MTHQPGVYVPLRALFLVFSVMESFVFEQQVLFSADFFYGFRP